MAESKLQPSSGTSTGTPKSKSPRWGKRIFENLKIAGAATLLAGSLALGGCGKAQILPVPPSLPRNIICDPGIGTTYVRPDGKTISLSKPNDGAQQTACCNTLPIFELAFLYSSEKRSP